MKNVRTVNVTSREERDGRLQAYLECGYKLVDCGYHWDMVEDEFEIVKIVDVRN